MSDDDRGSGVFAVAVTFLVLTWIMVPLRVYVRAIMTRSFGLDDWLLVITQVSGCHKIEKFPARN